MNADHLSFDFTPFPNDTFVLHALANAVITPPRATVFSIADLESLNQQALSGQADVCKISANILPEVLDTYVVLRAGAALGHGCGPCIVSTKQCALEKLNGKLLATPGPLSTAHMLLTLNGKHTGPFLALRPEKIFKAVCSGEAEAGLVIYEDRFVIERYGLHLVLDLGSWWEAATGLPLPLGVMVMRRSLGNELHLAMEQAIRQSLRYAQAFPKASRDYVREHAPEMDTATVASHIRSFVNEFSIELGPEGEAAVKTLIKQTSSLQGRTLQQEQALFPTGY